MGGAKSEEEGLSGEEKERQREKGRQAGRWKKTETGAETDTDI